jgi:hypothetical protein
VTNNGTLERESMEKQRRIKADESYNTQGKRCLKQKHVPHQVVNTYAISRGSRKTNILSRCSVAYVCSRGHEQYIREKICTNQPMDIRQMHAELTSCLHITVFWDTPCIWVGRYQCFGGNCCFMAKDKNWYQPNYTSSYPR